ncbi:MAG: sugar ABC transporter permease [Oscillospiraceae bacterium]|nr:sugar ABC transporter permease [Oscillospiraceae bacterium]
MAQVSNPGTVSGKKRKKITRQDIAPYLFVSPFIISFLVFLAYPLTQAFMLSFQQLVPFTHYVEWVGLDNFRRVINDPAFFTALWNVARYTFWTCAILIPVPMFIAFIVNSRFTKFKNLIRSLLFIPVLTSTIIAGIIFQHMFSSEPTGAFNELIGFFGAEPTRWLHQAGTAMFALVAIAVWRWTGVNMIYFLSGLNNVPTELYESAEVDGANGMQKFLFITTPMLRPIIIFVLTISITAGFSLFNEAYVFWGVTSPNNIGATIVILIYRAAFMLNDFGYAATLGVTLFFIVLIINLLQLKIMGLFRKED